MLLSFCIDQAVQAQIYRDPVGGMPFEVIQLEEFDGVWRTKGPKSWEGCYYEYEVTVYHPSTLRVEKCFTSDPYARGYRPFTQKVMEHCFRHTKICKKVQPLHIVHTSYC